METRQLLATKGLGPIVCIMIEGNNPGMPYDPQQDDIAGVNNDQNQIDPTIPAGEEENMPDPEEYEERQGDEEDMDDLPMEEPVPDIDEIEEDDEVDLLPEDEENLDDEEIL